MTGDDPIPGWQPTANVCFAFSDETGDDRTPAQLEALVADLRAAANRHGFDLSRQGTEAAFARYAHRVFTADGAYRD